MERPILFSGPMVRAILAGAKWQTRRLVRDVGGAELVRMQPGFKDGTTRPVFEYGGEVFSRRCPFGEVGDLLWVRESFAGDDVCGFAYRADHPDLARFTGDGEQPSTAWKPSIHMPRKASRILLRVREVRVECLHDISESDAVAEGVLTTVDHVVPTALGLFAERWDAMHAPGPGAWSENPWVWVVSFGREV